LPRLPAATSTGSRRDLPPAEAQHAIAPRPRGHCPILPNGEPMGFRQLTGQTR